MKTKKQNVNKDDGFPLIEIVIMIIVWIFVILMGQRRSE